MKLLARQEVILLGVRLDSEDKWGLKGGNGRVGRNELDVYDLF